MTPLNEQDAYHLRRAMELAREARESGNAPFGAALVGGDGRVLAEGRNTVTTERDVTGHAEATLAGPTFEEWLDSGSKHYPNGPTR